VTILRAIAKILETIAPAAVVARIAHIFQTIPAILPEIAAILSSIASIFAPIANVLEPVAMPTPLRARGARRYRRQCCQHRGNRDNLQHAGHRCSSSEAL
jgi:hypothetical protein